MTALSKRGLLRALAGLAAVSAAGGAYAAVRTPGIAAVDAVGAGEIGRAWLAAHPSDMAALRRAVFPNGQDAETGPRLAERVRADFRRDAVFVHRGWFLSETEARLCALIALAGTLA
jgi:stage V sporulation protein SpoVS